MVFNTSTVASYGDTVATGTDGGRTIACTKVFIGDNKENLVII